KSLYGHYARKYAEWEADEESRANGSMPPVFIVVCNNTNVSKAAFDYIAGYETEHRHADGGRSSRLGRWHCSTTRTARVGGTSRTRSSSIAGSLNPARACPTTSRSWPGTRSRTSRPSIASASLAATPRD